MVVNNGCGVQIVNIFSNVFVVVIYDHINKLKYTQTWFHHMKYASNAIIEPYNGAISTVEVTFKLDFEKFDLTQYTKHDIQWYCNKVKKLSTKHNVPIIFN
jgi:DNA gyrase/topoisomerase IV subunit B